VWLTFNEDVKERNLHSQTGLAVDMIMKSSLARKTLDNITCVVVAFDNFESHFFNKKNDSLSPKSSFYLHTVLDTKEEDDNDGGYLKTEPDKVSSAKLKLGTQVLISPKNKLPNATSGKYFVLILDLYSKGSKNNISPSPTKTKNSNKKYFANALKKLEISNI
jgi:hypothetical protein